MAIIFPSLDAIREISPPAGARLAHLPFILRMLAVALFITALARPQTGAGMQEIKTQGIDIMLALDTSTSMDIMDMAPSRIEAAKSAMLRFIGNRKNDRIGLIIFAGTSFTKCPLTLDYGVLASFIKPVTSGMVEDGTAIGMAIANGVNRLKDSKAKSRIIVLLTDGMNNRGLIDPMTATELAAGEKIKVYTIGVGSRGLFYVQMDHPVFGRQTVPVQSDIDDELLKKIAAKTGGAYFAAKDERELARIYEAIDRLEKSELKSKIYYEYTEQFAPFAMLGLLLISVEALVSKKILRSLPE